MHKIIYICDSTNETIHEHEISNSKLLIRENEIIGFVEEMEGEIPAKLKKYNVVQIRHVFSKRSNDLQFEIRQTMIFLNFLGNFIGYHDNEDKNKVKWKKTEKEE